MLLNRSHRHPSQKSSSCMARNLLSLPRPAENYVKPSNPFHQEFAEHYTQVWVQERTPRFPDNPGSKTEADKEIIGSRNVCLLGMLRVSAGKLLKALETIILQSWPQNGPKIETSKASNTQGLGPTRNNPRDQKIKSFGNFFTISGSQFWGRQMGPSLLEL